MYGYIINSDSMECERGLLLIHMKTDPSICAVQIKHPKEGSKRTFGMKGVCKYKCTSNKYIRRSFVYMSSTLRLHFLKDSGWADGFKVKSLGCKDYLNLSPLSLLTPTFGFCFCIATKENGIR